MFNRPTLPPMNYRLWLPYCGTYVRATAQNNRRIIGTLNRDTALRMPEAQAMTTARTIIRKTGQVIELRPVVPAEAANDEGAR